jgi:hypothetical protein
MFKIFGTLFAERERERPMNSGLIPLLSIAPDVDKFINSDKSGKSRATLDILGIKKEDIKDVEALTNVALLVRAMSGDIQAKKYLDDRADAERRARGWDAQKGKRQV